MYLVTSMKWVKLLKSVANEAKWPTRAVSKNNSVYIFDGMHERDKAYRVDELIKQSFTEYENSSAYTEMKF